MRRPADSFFAKWLPDGTPVVRVMTNTPALVDEAMTAISAGPYATEEHLALAEEMFAPLGRTIRVPESQQDAVTALSGSGPAYFYYLVEAMTDAGILLGPAAPGGARPDRADRDRLGDHAAGLRRTPGQTPRGGHLAGRYDDQRDSRAGKSRGTRGLARRAGSRP